MERAIGLCRHRVFTAQRPSSARRVLLAAKLQTVHTPAPHERSRLPHSTQQLAHSTIATAQRSATQAFRAGSHTPGVPRQPRGACSRSPSSSPWLGGAVGCSAAPLTRAPRPSHTPCRAPQGGAAAAARHCREAHLAWPVPKRGRQTHAALHMHASAGSRCRVLTLHPLGRRHPPGPPPPQNSSCTQLRGRGRPRRLVRGLRLHSPETRYVRVLLERQEHAAPASAPTSSTLVRATHPIGAPLTQLGLHAGKRPASTPAPSRRCHPARTPFCPLTTQATFHIP